MAIPKIFALQAKVMMAIAKLFALHASAIKWEQNHRAPDTYINNNYINVMNFMTMKSKDRTSRKYRKAKD